MPHSSCSRAAALGLAALLAWPAAWAQSSAERAGAMPGGEPASTLPAQPSRPSMPSGPSGPSTAGNAPDAHSAAVPADARALDGGGLGLGVGGMYGGGTLGAGADLGAVVNTGSPTRRHEAARKVCPPGLENRNNFCVPPAGQVLRP